MTPEVEALVERLRGLMDRATLGPWEIDSEPNEDGEYGPGPDPGRGFDDYMILGSEGGKILGSDNATHKLIEEEFDEDGYKIAWDTYGRANATLAVEAVNALPTLLAALSASAQEPGWVLVPREPTEAMVDATVFDVSDPTDECRYEDEDLASIVWSAMIAAAPSHSPRREKPHRRLNVRQQSNRKRADVSRLWA